MYKQRELLLISEPEGGLFNTRMTLKIRKCSMANKGCKWWKELQ